MNGYGSHRQLHREQVQRDPNDHEDGLDGQVAAGAQESRDRLAELTDRLDVDVERKAAARRAWGVQPLTRRHVAHVRPSGTARPATSTGAGQLRFFALPPVVGQQVVEDVVDGHRAQ